MANFKFVKTLGHLLLISFGEADDSEENTTMYMYTVHAQVFKLH